LKEFPSEKLNILSPNYLVYAHDAEIVCMSANKNTDLLASIDKSDCLMIHTLRTGIAMNKIRIGYGMMDKIQMVTQVHNIWLNRGYVTISSNFSF
jgi:hypothetical protein